MAPSLRDGLPNQQPSLSNQPAIRFFISWLNLAPQRVRPAFALPRACRRRHGSSATLKDTSPYRQSSTGKQALAIRPIQRKTTIPMTTCTTVMSASSLRNRLWKRLSLPVWKEDRGRRHVFSPTRNFSEKLGQEEKRIKMLPARKTVARHPSLFVAGRVRPAPGRYRAVRIPKTSDEVFVRAARRNRWLTLMDANLCGRRRRWSARTLMLVSPAIRE